MNATVRIRNLVLGDGTPKICVPLAASNSEELAAAAGKARKSAADMAEWRADHFAGADKPDAAVGAAEALRRELGDLPLLFTFRTQGEGGEGDIDGDAYVELNRRLIASGWIDAIDLELAAGEAVCRDLAAAARAAGVAVVVSSHDFRETPPGEEIERRLAKMRELGADIPKIAVTPNSADDVLTVLGATLRASRKLAARCPVVVIAMGALGAVSRVAGQTFGSCLTFGAAGRPSAPGQLAADELRAVLRALGEGLGCSYVL